MGRKSKAEPVYATIYTTLRRQIFSGRLAPGDMLPSENQLCSEYNVSRETVRKGLKELESEGLIFSRPKVGYFVSKPNHSDFTLTFSEQLENCTPEYKDIHGILPDKRIQQVLDIPEGKIVIEFAQVTRDPEGIPVAYDIKYVPYERAYPSVESEIRFAVFPDITFSKMASYAFYTDIQVRAVGASAAIASVLQCEVGEPLLLIERIFIQQDRKRIGYALHYARQPFGTLHGTSGSRL